MGLNGFSIGHFIGLIIVSVQSATELAKTPFFFIFDKSVDFQRRVFSLKR